MKLSISISRKFHKTLASCILISVMGCTSMWHKTHELRAQFACGITPETLQRIIRNLGAPDLKGMDISKEGEYGYYFGKNGSTFYLVFNDVGLVSYQEVRVCGLMCKEYALQINVCTGERTGFPMIEIFAPSELEEANIYLDGKDLTSFGTAFRQKVSISYGVQFMTFGEHVIEIKKTGYKPIKREFKYYPNMYWPEEKEISIYIEKSEVIKGLEG